MTTYITWSQNYRFHCSTRDHSGKPCPLYVTIFQTHYCDHLHFYIPQKSQLFRFSRCQFLSLDLEMPKTPLIKALPFLQQIARPKISDNHLMAKARPGCGRTSAVGPSSDILQPVLLHELISCL